MSQAEREYLRARAFIRYFAEFHGVKWDRFSRLRVFKPVFASLDTRRWKPSILKELPSQEKMKTKTIELARLIERSEREVLRVLGFSDDRPLLTESGDFERFWEPRVHDGGKTLTVESIRTQALMYAGTGVPELAFKTAADGYTLFSGNGDGQAGQLIATQFYFGTRYLRPHAFIGHLRSWVGPNLNVRDLRPVDRMLAEIQLASSLVDRGLVSGAAAQIFERGDVRNFIRSGREIPWSRPQLLRANAAFILQQRKQSDEDIGLIKDAASWTDPGNLRGAAIAMSLALRHRERFAEAWQVIQPHYAESGALLHRIKRERSVYDADLLHRFACIFYGAILRSWTKASYPAEEIERDAEIMNFCLDRYKRIEMEYPWLEQQQGPVALHPSIRLVRLRCTRPAFSRTDVDVVTGVISAISEP